MSLDLPYTKKERRVWGATYTDVKMSYLGYDVQIDEAPNRTFNIWIRLHGEKRAGPTMGFKTYQSAIAYAVKIIRQLEAA